MLRGALSRAQDEHQVLVSQLHALRSQDPTEQPLTLAATKLLLQSSHLSNEFARRLADRVASIPEGPWLGDARMRALIRDSKRALLDALSDVSESHTTNGGLLTERMVSLREVRLQYPIFFCRVITDFLLFLSTHFSFPFFSFKITPMFFFFF